MVPRVLYKVNCIVVWYSHYVSPMWELPQSVYRVQWMNIRLVYSDLWEMRRVHSMDCIAHWHGGLKYIGATAYNRCIQIGQRGTNEVCFVNSSNSWKRIHSSNPTMRLFELKNSGSCMSIWKKVNSESWLGLLWDVIGTVLSRKKSTTHVTHDYNKYGIL